MSIPTEHAANNSEKSINSQNIPHHKTTGESDAEVISLDSDDDKIDVVNHDKLTKSAKINKNSSENDAAKFRNQISDAAIPILNTSKVRSLLKDYNDTEKRIYGGKRNKRKSNLSKPRNNFGVEDRNTAESVLKISKVVSLKSISENERVVDLSNSVKNYKNQVSNLNKETPGQNEIEPIEIDIEDENNVQESTLEPIEVGNVIAVDSDDSAEVVNTTRKVTLPRLHARQNDTAVKLLAAKLKQAMKESMKNTDIVSANTNNNNATKSRVTSKMIEILPGVFSEDIGHVESCYREENNVSKIASSNESLNLTQGIIDISPDPDPAIVKSTVRKTPPVCQSLSNPVPVIVNSPQTVSPVIVSGNLNKSHSGKFIRNPALAVVKNNASGVVPVQPVVVSNGLPLISPVGNASTTVIQSNTPNVLQIPTVQPIIVSNSLPVVLSRKVLDVRKTTFDIIQPVLVQSTPRVLKSILPVKPRCEPSMTGAVPVTMHNTGAPLGTSNIPVKSVAPTKSIVISGKHQMSTSKVVYVPVPTSASYNIAKTVSSNNMLANPVMSSSCNVPTAQPDLTIAIGNRYQKTYSGPGIAKSQTSENSNFATTILNLNSLLTRTAKCNDKDVENANKNNSFKTVNQKGLSTQHHKAPITFPNVSRSKPEFEFRYLFSKSQRNVINDKILASSLTEDVDELKVKTEGNDSARRKRNKEHVVIEIDPVSPSPPPSPSSPVTLQNLLEIKDGCNTICDLCGIIFKEPANLKNHQRNVHKESSVYTCDICCQVFEDETKCRNHEASHIPTKRYKLSKDYKNPSLEMYTCDMCLKFFADIHVLKEHQIHCFPFQYLGIFPTKQKLQIKKINPKQAINQKQKKNDVLEVIDLSSETEVVPEGKLPESVNDVTATPASVSHDKPLEPPPSTQTKQSLESPQEQVTPSPRSTKSLEPLPERSTPSPPMTKSLEPLKDRSTPSPQAKQSPESSREQVTPSPRTTKSLEPLPERSTPSPQTTKSLEPLPERSTPSPQTKRNLDALEGGNTIICYLCGAVFTEQGKMSDHWKEIHKEDPVIFTCDICCQVFSDETLCKEHEATHIPPKRFKPNDNLSTSSLKQKYYYSCEFCFKNFDNENDYKSHAKTHFSMKNISNKMEHVRKFECENCTRVIFGEKNWQKHKRSKCITPRKTNSTYSNSNLFKLDDKSRSSLANLFLNATKKTKCELCDIYLTTKEVKDHMNMHKQSHECEICMQIFFTYNSLVEHMTKDHFSSGVSYNWLMKDALGGCEQETKTDVDKILASAREMMGRNSSCPLCGEIFDTKASLDLHIVESHVLPVPVPNTINNNTGDTDQNKGNNSNRTEEEVEKESSNVFVSETLAVTMDKQEDKIEKSKEGNEINKINVNKQEFTTENNSEKSEINADRQLSTDKDITETIEIEENVNKTDNTSENTQSLEMHDDLIKTFDLKSEVNKDNIDERDNIKESEEESMQNMDDSDKNIKTTDTSGNIDKNDETVDHFKENTNKIDSIIETFNENTNKKEDITAKL